MSTSWHDSGLFMGMHWIWWFLWLVTIAVLLSALWRVFADRSETHRRAERHEAAEEALRKRFAAGEIDEEEFANRMRILRDVVSNP
jgi:uncharacterized membrane protein